MMLTRIGRSKTFDTNDEDFADTFSDEKRTIVYHQGSCHPEACSGETACRSFSQNNSYTCVCTHDSLPPTSNGTCPRLIVQNVQSGRIPNVQPPSNKIPMKGLSNDSNVLQNYPTTSNHPIMGNFLVPAIVLTASFLLFSTICIIKMRSRKRRAGSPVNLKSSMLLPERYVPNPQYQYACAAPGVPVIKKETLTFLNELGEGCFGKVFKGELIIEVSEHADVVAIKVLKETASKENEEDFFREVEIMSAFRHPNILSLIGVVLREGSVSPMMVFEYMEHGDLADVLRVQRRLFPTCQISMDSNSTVPLLCSASLLMVALQIARGMEYLAAQRFVHRDLACRNCLVAEGPIVKIADFGMSRDVYTCDYYKMGGSRLLPVRWMSPESVVYGRFTLESDIWSYGVVLWEIYSFGKQPYYGHSNDEVVKLILDGIMLIPPDNSPSVICELMKNCWKTEPKHRITFTQIREILEKSYDESRITGTASTIPREQSNVKQTTSTNSNRTLPRPPPLPNTLPPEDVLDSQGYLLPRLITDPVQYLSTLPD